MRSSKTEDWANRITELIFGDKLVNQLYRKAIREAAIDGEISNDTIQAVELRIREMIQEWEV